MEWSAEVLIKVQSEWEVKIIGSSGDLVSAQMPLLREAFSHDPL